MNIIDTSLITSTKQQPFLGGSLAFLQNASKEMIVAICRSIMGETKYAASSTTGIIMSGCTFSGTLDTIFNGFIFFNGELYYFNGQSGLNAYSNAPVFVESNSFVSPDPTTFSDLSISNVHQQRRLTLADQVLGTGLFNLRDALYVNSDTSSLIAIPTFATTGASAQNVTGASYITPKAITGGSGLKRNFKITVCGNIEYNEANGSVEGGTLTLRNSTTSTDLSFAFARTTGNASTAGIQNMGAVSLIYRGTFDPNTNLILTLQRGITNNVTLYNCFMLIEEYN